MYGTCHSLNARKKREHESGKVYIAWKWSHNFARSRSFRIDYGPGIYTRSRNLSPNSRGLRGRKFDLGQMSHSASLAHFPGPQRHQQCLQSVLKPKLSFDDRNHHRGERTAPGVSPGTGESNEVSSLNSNQFMILFTEIEILLC